MTPRSEGTSGTEPRPTIGIGHLTVLRGNEFSLLCWPGGDFDAASDPSVGLYRRDTRYLSRFRVLCWGEELTQLDSHERGFALYSTSTNSTTADARGRPVPGQTVVLGRERALHDGVVERLTISNYGHTPITLDLAVQFECDFQDIFVIRGVDRQSEAPAASSRVAEDEVRWTYDGLDDVSRSTRLRFHPVPNALADGEAHYQLELAPRDSATVRVSIDLDDEPAPETPEAALAAARSLKTSLTGGWAAVESSSAALNALLERAVSDVASLSTKRDGCRFLAAGVPWFDAMFGRDSLISGMALLGFDSSILRDALLLLADSQARSTEPASDAEPGKIAHETRCGELASIGEVPFARYYGSVDATPLFVWAAREYLRWTGDQKTVEALRPALQRAVEWCTGHRSLSPLGALTYWRQSANGLEHQGWKDSEDALPLASEARGPIALVEVQGYLAAALAAASDLGVAGFGTSESVPSAVLGLIDRKYFPSGVPAMAIDGAGEPVSAVTSNPGHLLWTGSCSPEHAQSVSDALFGRGLFTGWGIRTLSMEDPCFNPLGYHTGSVWPHDNAIILAGLRRYGFVDEVRRLGGAMIEAMLGFPDHRVPELFSGDERGDRLFPTPYPVASRPQAWSAASLPWLLMTLAGITPENDSTLHVVRPVLPPWLDWLRFRNVRFGSSTVDLTLRRIEDHASVEIERQRGPGSVVLSAQWPVPLLGK